MRLLTRDHFIPAIHDALTDSGIDSSLYAGHSFRVGAATTTTLQGLQDSLVKTLGRWESSAYQVYIWTPHSTLTSVVRSFVQLSDATSSFSFMYTHTQSSMPNYVFTISLTLFHKSTYSLGEGAYVIALPSGKEGLAL